LEQTADAAGIYTYLIIFKYIPLGIDDVFCVLPEKLVVVIMLTCSYILWNFFGGIKKK